MSFNKGDFIEAAPYNTFIEGKSDYKFEHKLLGPAGASKSFTTPPPSTTFPDSRNLTVGRPVSSTYTIKDSVGTTVATLTGSSTTSIYPFVEYEVLPNRYVDFEFPGGSYTLSISHQGSATFWTYKYPIVKQGWFVKAINAGHTAFVPAVLTAGLANAGRVGATEDL
jgi:hypothetical protein